MRNRRLRLQTALLPAVFLAGCLNLSAPQGNAPDIYVLDAQPAIPASAAKHDLVLAVTMPRARPGYDTAQIAYLQRPHELDYFVTSRWTDAPTRMLYPLLLHALEKSGGFRAVVRAGTEIPADLRLDIELIRLEQDFTVRPSRVQMTLQAQLTDVRSNRVLEVQQFDGTENSASEDAYGGVIAANRLAQRMLAQVTEFCVTVPRSNTLRPAE